MEPLITDPPRSGQPPKSGQNLRNYRRANTSEKRTPFASRDPDNGHQQRPGLTQPIHFFLRERTEKPLPLHSHFSEPHALLEHWQRGYNNYTRMLNTVGATQLGICPRCSGCITQEITRKSGHRLRASGCPYLQGSGVNTVIRMLTIRLPFFSSVGPS